MKRTYTIAKEVIPCPIMSKEVQLLLWEDAKHDLVRCPQDQEVVGGGVRFEKHLPLDAPPTVDIHSTGFRSLINQEVAFSGQKGGFYHHFMPFPTPAGVFGAPYIVFDPKTGVGLNGGSELESKACSEDRVRSQQ